MGSSKRLRRGLKEIEARYTSQDRKTGFKFGGGKIWESKDGRYLYRYIYSNIHGKKSRSLMRAKMPGWHGVKR